MLSQTPQMPLSDFTDQPDSPEAAAIFRTILYADVFNFPPTSIELHHFLIGCAVPCEAVQNAIEHSGWLAEHIICTDGYYALRESPQAAAERRQHDAAARALWQVARRYGTILAHLPFVRMVALTGALAMRNPSGPHDDIDYLIVTAPGRVWITRALCVLVVKMARRRGVDLCPNYVLAETALLQNQQDLFIAHEITQMVPLSGLDIYKQMRSLNRWTLALLPNAIGPLYQEADSKPHGLGLFLQHLGEVLLGGRLGNALESWEQARKRRKFEPDLHKPGSNAQLDDQRVKGHFNDHGLPIIERYHARLRHYGLAEVTDVLPVTPQIEIENG